jgi:hypothetical protein
MRGTVADMGGSGSLLSKKPTSLEMASKLIDNDSNKCTWQHVSVSTLSFAIVNK